MPDSPANMDDANHHSGGISKSGSLPTRSDMSLGMGIGDRQRCENPGSSGQVEIQQATPESPVKGLSSQRIAMTEEPKPRPRLTLFSVPKPFGIDSHTDLIQINAIRSWAALGPQVEVVLLGDEPGVASAASRIGVRHVAGLRYNEHGTPRVDSAFKLAEQHAEGQLLAYCNSDVILLNDFLNAIEIIVRNDQFDAFLAFGRRTDLDLQREVSFDQLDSIQQLMTEAVQRGVISSQVCKEYFIFSRNLFDQMPPFAIGRGNWDNWIIHHVKSTKIPVINISDLVTVIHQNHDYQHTGADRLKCYVSGPEAKGNESLGGGRHLISGSVGTWRLTADGIRKERPLLLNPEFWADIPRFLRLMGNLWFGR